MNRLLTNKQIPFLLFALLGITQTIPGNLERIVVVLMFVYTVLSFRKSKYENLKGTLTFKKAALPVAFLLLNVVGLLYSELLHTGWKTVETKLALLVVPVFVALEWNRGMDKKDIRKLLIYFIVFNFIGYAYALVRAFLDYQLNTLSSEQLFVYFSRENLAGYLNFHPPYYALIAACCIQAIIYLFVEHYQHITKAQKFFLLVVGAVALLFILLLGARMPLIALALTIPFWLGVIIILYKKYVYGVGLIVLFILGIAASFVFIPNIRSRFVEISRTELEPPRGENHNSTNLRVGQLYCSIEVLKDNYLIGTGTGDIQPPLNACYQANNYSHVLYRDSYNPHNQYLESWISLGILGLILVLALVLYPLYSSFVQRDWLVFTLMVVLGLCMLTESVLQTNKGVMIFSFIYGIFIIRNPKPESITAGTQTNE